MEGGQEVTNYEWGTEVSFVLAVDGCDEGGRDGRGVGEAITKVEVRGRVVLERVCLPS